MKSRLEGKKKRKNNERADELPTPKKSKQVANWGNSGGRTSKENCFKY
jgi:hypothetical protein